MSCFFVCSKANPGHLHVASELPPNSTVDSVWFPPARLYTLKSVALEPEKGPLVLGFFLHTDEWRCHIIYQPLVYIYILRATALLFRGIRLALDRPGLDRVGTWVFSHQ